MISSNIPTHPYGPSASLSAELRLICERNARIACRALHVSDCYLFFSSSELVFHYSPPTHAAQSADLALISWLCEQVAHSHSPLLFEGDMQHPILSIYPDPLPDQPLYIAAYALHRPDQSPIGALILRSDCPRSWGDEDLELIADIVGSIVAEVTLHHQSRAYSLLAEHIQRSEHFLQLALDALTDEITILDEQGVIIAMNEATLTSGRYKVAHVTGGGLGSSYFDLCASVSHECADAAEVMMSGIRSILAGEELYFTHEYSCPHAGEVRWYSARISSFTDAGKLRVVVAHQETTTRKRVEDRLRESEGLYRAVISSLHEGILVYDARGQIQACNQSASRILNIPSDRIVGHNSTYAGWTLVDIDGQPFPMQQIPVAVSLMTGQSCTNVVIGMLPPEGEQIWISINTHPLFRDGEPRPYGVVTSFTDITERRRTEADLLKLSLVASKADSGILICDNSGAVEWCNEAFHRLTGYPLEEVRGRKPVEMLHGEQSDVSAGPRMITSLRAGIPVMEEILLYRRDGTPFWAMVNITPILDSRGILNKFIVIQNDITYKKELEQMKSDFVALVSHELRTPLTSIRGALGLLAGGLAGDLPPQARSMIDIATSNSDRLVRLINDILDIEKIASGRMNFSIQPMPILPLIQQTIEANRAYTDQYGTWVEIEGVLPDELQLFVDSDRIIQVFTNLISNAAKFSPRGSPITVTLSYSMATARIAVTDRGPGIPLHFRNNIFQRFAQADSSSTRQKGGSGLGLNISKAIVDRLGGTIGFESAIDVGTTFFVDLRVVPTPDLVAPPKAPRLLICEPDADVAAGLVAMFSHRGYQVNSAGTIDVARMWLARFIYDAMALDFDLDTDDARSWVSELRGNERTSHMPIVMVSASDAAHISVDDQTTVVLPTMALDPASLLQVIAQAAQPMIEGHPCILHVEDDPDIRQIIDFIFQGVAQVRTATTVSEACGLLLRYHVDLILLDLSLPDGSGDRLFRFMRELQLPPIPVVVFTAGDEHQAFDEEFPVAAFLVKSRITNDVLRETVKTFIQI